MASRWIAARFQKMVSSRRKMADLKDKFQDQRWLERRAHILELSNNQCEESGSSDSLQVHICFYVRGKEPWEFPNEAFKCYCNEHREQRQRVERAITRILPFFATTELDPLLNALKFLGPLGPKRAAVMERLYVFAKREYYSLDIAPTEDATQILSSKASGLIRVCLSQ